MHCFKVIVRTAFCAVLTIGSAVSADGLDAQIHSTEIAEGTSFQLVLSGDARDITAAPDLEPLTQDFEVLGTSQSRQTQIINGARSDTLQWAVTLSPKRRGTLTIPVVNAGAASSEALSIDVVDAANLPAVTVPGAPELTVNVPKGTHYVQQEIPVTVRITSGANLQSGSLVMPQSPDFILTQFGEDKITRAAGKSGPVNIMERTYMLRPQKAGEIKLPPVTLNAVLSDPNARDPFQSLFSRGRLGQRANDPFAAMFNAGKQLMVRSAPMALSVKASPAGSDTWFLPAKNVQISAVWKPENPVFRAGEAVTLAIQVVALGATGTQLPDLDIPQVEGLRIYLDGTQNRTVDTVEGTAALREYTYSVVPTEGGLVTFPEIQLDWFDIGSETERKEVLEAQVITVAGAVPAAVDQADASTVKTATHDTSVPLKVGSNRRAYIAASLLLLGFLVACAGWFFARRRAVAHTSTQAGARASALHAARVALRGNDLSAFYAAGQKWMVLTNVADHDALWRTFPSLAANWETLEAALFAEGKNTDKTIGKAALEEMEYAERQTVIQNRNISKASGVLKPLYPIGNNKDVWALPE